MIYVCVCVCTEEPEEELSIHDLEERAKSGDAKAQTRVSINMCEIHVPVCVSDMY